MFYTYRIISKLKNKSKLYIGFTSNLNRRWNEHKREVAKGNQLYLYKCLRKYGVSSFSMELISKHDKREDAAKEEIRLIELHRTNKVKNKKGIGMNLTDGGDGLWRLGQKRDPKSVEKAAAKARVEIIATHPDGREEVFSGLGVAARALGLDNSQISKVCRGEDNSSKGFKFRFVDMLLNEKAERLRASKPTRSESQMGHFVSEETKSKISANKLGKPAVHKRKAVIVTDREGNETRYESIKHCYEALGIGKNTIHRAIDKGRRALGIYLIRYDLGNNPTSIQGDNNVTIDS